MKLYAPKYYKKFRCIADKGEHSCVFYNKDKFNLISTETKWLSDTPDEVSRVEGSAYIRIVTFAVLERKSDGKRFVHANTHLDFGKAAVEQVKYIKKFAAKYDYPMFITGDFNFDPSSEGYAEFTKERFVTSSAVAEEANISNTFPACENPTTIIDYCLVTPESIDVKFYKVCGEQFDGDYGSDHLPVYIEYNLK
jgi:endonuclease/exonuclease/phosphatase family metal-dependent hydrolase